MCTGPSDHSISRRRPEITTASIRCCYSQREIFDRNNSKPQRTPPTQAPSHAVPRTAFKQQQAKDTEIKSNIILLADKTDGATALVR